MANKKKIARKKAAPAKKRAANKKKIARKRAAPAKKRAAKKKVAKKKGPARSSLAKTKAVQRAAAKEPAPVSAIVEPAASGEPGPAPETPAEVATAAGPIESRNRLAAAMARNPGALADMCPEFNDFNGKWENNLTDERGNGLDIVEYDTEEEAEREIDEYCRHLDELDKAAAAGGGGGDGDGGDGDA